MCLSVVVAAVPDLGPSRLDRIDPGTVRDASGGVLPGVTVTATLQVEASAGLIETRNPGIGIVAHNDRASSCRSTAARRSTWST